MMDSQRRSLLIEPLPRAIKKSRYFFISLLKAEIEVRREKDPSRILRHRYDGNSTKFGIQQGTNHPAPRRPGALFRCSCLLIFIFVPPVAARPQFVHDGSDRRALPRALPRPPPLGRISHSRRRFGRHHPRRRARPSLLRPSPVRPSPSATASSAGPPAAAAASYVRPTSPCPPRKVS